MTKIAIIDDEVQILQSIQRYLSRRKQFEITVFDNPTEARKPLLNAEFDLVLLDIMMPQLNGIDILKELKKEQVPTKVIMMTAYSTLERAILSKDIGADDYLTKPFVSLRDVENKILDNIK